MQKPQFPDADPVGQALELLRGGEIDVDEARRRLIDSQTRGLGYAALDLDRPRRCGAAEVVFAERKTPEHVVGIVQALVEQDPAVLVTRCRPEHVEALQAAMEPPVEVSDTCGCVLVGTPREVPDLPTIPIVTAGTSDLPVAEEAIMTCRALGQPATGIHDVGVAGLHRLIERLPELRQARVIVCIAGMEGALPSVLGGLVCVPVIAVPTSVGYGAALGGLAALLGMLTSCASGVVAVNIDNGFGAAYTACMINRNG